MAINLRFPSFEWELDGGGPFEHQFDQKRSKVKEGREETLIDCHHEQRKACGIFQSSRTLSTDYAHIIQILRLPQSKIMRNKKS